MARYVCRYPAPAPRIGGGGASNEFRKATNQDKNETGGTPPAPRSGLTQHAATHWHPSVSAFFPPLCIRCFPEFVGSSLLRLSSPLCIHGSNIPTDDNDLPEQGVATGTSHWVAGEARFVQPTPQPPAGRSRQRRFVMTHNCASLSSHRTALWRRVTTPSVLPHGSSGVPAPEHNILRLCCWPCRQPWP